MVKRLCTMKAWSLDTLNLIHLFQKLSGEFKGKSLKVPPYSFCTLLTFVN